MSIPESPGEPVGPGGPGLPGGPGIATELEPAAKSSSFSLQIYSQFMFTTLHTVHSDLLSVF